jgi:hypothetical protein
MTPKLLNLRKKLRERLKTSDVDQDTLALIAEIERETDDLLARTALAR